MQTSNNILNELQEISTLVAGIQKANVFTLPDGYFATLSDTVLMNIKENTLINSITDPPVMQVPVGYFDALASNILSKIKLQEQDEPIELSPLLQGIQNQKTFTIPQHYFQSLADNILDKISTKLDAVTELKELSPLLFSVQYNNVFTVPQDYFNNLSSTILTKVEPPQAKVISMGKRTTSTILKYAIAAVFTGAMALGIYKFTNGSATKIIIPSYVAEGQKIKNVDEELLKVTDDDIIKYLQANGSDVDAALVANTIDENELPTQDDYLTDDKALDKYLDNADLNDLKN